MAHKIPDAPGIKTDAASIPASGFISFDLYRFFVDLINALKHRLAVTGYAAFAGGTTIAVTFATAEPADTYDVFFAAPDSKTYWATSKTVNGFTANASSAVTANVRYQIIRA